MSDKPKRVIIWCRVSSLEQGAANKESIPDQLKRQRELAAKNGWIITDEIITDFSMDYFTYAEFSQAASAAGWTAQERMIAHWINKDFDILTCRYLDRVGREQSILSEFVGRTIKAGATIIPLDEATVDSVNHRMSSAMAGLGAAAHIDKLKAGRNLGMIGRAGRGEKISKRIPMFYAADESGKLYPDRVNYQRLFDDIAELFLVGTSFERFPHELAQRGHLNPESGKPFNKSNIQRLLWTARTWGHAEFNRTGRKRGSFMKRSELWVTGRGEPPADVYFKRDVCEPLWGGMLASDMIDELERRFNAIRGAARPNNTYPFSNLCVCAVCGRNMAVQRKQNPNVLHEYVVCHNGRSRHGCDNYRMVRFEKIQTHLDTYIQGLLANPDNLFVTDTPLPSSRLPKIQKELDKVQTRIDNLTDIIQDAPVASRPDYQRKIDMHTAQRTVLQAEQARILSAQHVHEYTLKSQTTALESIRNLDLWSQPPTVVNQTLRKILGNRRIECNDGEVIELRVTG